MTSTTSDTAIITRETAAAPSIFPMLNSRYTLTGRTSVRCRVAPANTKTGPNSPRERAQASGVEQIRDARLSLGVGHAKQSREKVDVLENAELEIQIFA